MITSDNKYWASLNKKQILDNAGLWAKEYTIKRLEMFVDYYRSVQDRSFKQFTEEEKQGIETDRTQSYKAVSNRERTALIARFMRECPKEEIPEWL